MRRAFLFLFMMGALAAPAMAGGVGEGFGVQIKDSRDAGALPAIRAAGFGLVRVPLYWAVVESEKGRYDWAESDAVIVAARRAGLRVMVTVMGGHAAYDGLVRAPRGNKDQAVWRNRAPARAESIDAFARFAAAAAQRYDAADILWEIGNEPDLRRFWPPKPDAGAYAALLQQSCTQIKRVAPRAFVLGPALGRVPERPGDAGTYFLQVVLQSAGGCIDALSVHPYRRGAQEPEAAMEDYKRVTAIMAQMRFYGPLIRSEWGYSRAQVTSAQQADYALRGRFVDMLWGIPVSIWYEWQDQPHPDAVEAGFGLKDRAAIQDMLQRVGAARLERQIFTSRKADWLVLLRDGADEVLVGWTRGLAQTLCLAVDGAPSERALTQRPSILARGKEIKICTASAEPPDASPAGTAPRLSR